MSKEPSPAKLSTETIDKESANCLYPCSPLPEEIIKEIVKHGLRETEYTEEEIRTGLKNYLPKIMNEVYVRYAYSISKTMTSASLDAFHKLGMKKSAKPVNNVHQGIDAATIERIQRLNYIHLHMYDPEWAKNWKLMPQVIGRANRISHVSQPGGVELLTSLHDSLYSTQSKLKKIEKSMLENRTKLKELKARNLKIMRMINEITVCDIEMHTEPSEITIPIPVEIDIENVMMEASVNRETAINALLEVGGDPIEAIISLTLD